MPDGTTLTRNWLRFGGLLRGLGFDAGPSRMLPFLQTVELVETAPLTDLKTAVHAHFARRREDLALLDLALLAFLEGRRELGVPTGPAPSPSAGTDPRAAARVTVRQLSVLDDLGPEEDEEALQVAAYSRLETLRRKDFEALNDQELKDVRRLIRLMRVPAGLRRSRRFRRGGDERLDLRRLLRSSLRFNGEPLVLSWRRRRWKPRPLVLLCDISGSMERYTRVLLHFVYAMEHAGERVEAFVFATRLTRITRQLRTHDPDLALSRVMATVEDWSGGTRIGEAIETFNRRYARRVLAHGAAVIVISDGWDRGEPAQLRAAVAGLQRGCHRLIWMNPLLGAPGYEPLTLGLRAALPYVDNFLPAHNLTSLEALGRLLLEAQDRRPVRRQLPAAALGA